MESMGCFLEKDEIQSIQQYRRGEGSIVPQQCLSVTIKHSVSFYHSVKCSFDLYIHLLIVLYVFLSAFYWFIYLSFSALIVLSINISFNLLHFCLHIYWSFCQFTNVYFFINLYVDCFVWLFYLSMHHLFDLIWTSIVHFLYFLYFLLYYEIARVFWAFAYWLRVRVHPSWSLCDVMIPKYYLNQSFIVYIFFMFYDLSC